MSDLIGKIKRGLRKPPRIILQRIIAEASTHLDRYHAPLRQKRLNLLKKTRFKTITALWDFLAARPYPTFFGPIDFEEHKKLCPSNTQFILDKAQQALDHKVDLLGSGLICLGEKIDWQKDYKTGFDWPCKFIRDIDYCNPDRPSDVKFPWEVSRLQWLIPAGQAYLLTEDEKYAAAVKDILMQWIDSNPYAYSINWTCTMEVAFRIVTWTWFFKVFNASQSWQDKTFQSKFLKSLFLHVDFTARHLEYSDVNGNHYTADAAGLVFGGLFFGTGDAANKWQELGWKILCSELPKQVFADGVNYEASTAYHRLVLELFLLPALYREVCNLKVTDEYRERLISMARFTAAYTKPNGLTPLWGDADDARTLPFGDQPINDHRYLCGVIGTHWNVQDLKQSFDGSLAEVYWLLGPQKCFELLNMTTDNFQLKSQAFAQGGFYIMRNATDHIFIDCGPLGLAGRGGHGHNDCLAFEAVLDGEPLITDCGAYLYTASYQERNNFRSTAYHNTPQINGEEINRFIRWDYLWNLHNDAKPIVHAWKHENNCDFFSGSHTGYEKLGKKNILKRNLILNHQLGQLTIEDDFSTCENFTISVPLHLSPQILIERITDDKIVLISNHKKFLLEWQSQKPWNFSIEAARFSPSYGVVLPTKKLLWQIPSAIGDLKLTVRIKRFND